MAGGGVSNPPSRRAVCDDRKHGSVGAGAGNRPGYPTGVHVLRALRVGVRGRELRTGRW
jgi:hypothetical protein